MQLTSCGWQKQTCQKIKYYISATAVAHERTAGALFQTYLRRRIDDAATYDPALHMSDGGGIYLVSAAPTLDVDEALLKCINDRVFPVETRPPPLTVCPLQSDRCSATDHRVVPQVRPVDEFRRRTDTSEPGVFDLAQAVAMAAPQMGYLSPNRAATAASPLRHDVVIGQATRAARTFTFNWSRYDAIRCGACRPDRWTNDHTAVHAVRDVCTL